MAALGRLFSENAVFVGRYGTTLRGRQKIEAAHRKIHEEAYRRSTLSVREPEVSLLAEGVAVMIFGTCLVIGNRADDGARSVETIAQAVATGGEEGWLIQSMANVEITPMSS